MAKKPRTTTRLRYGDKVEIDDDEDSGTYEVRIINVAEDDCWIYAEMEDGRDVEQQFPLTWIEDLFRSQNADEWHSRKATVPVKPKGW
jgi:hypothetical protein